MMMIRRISSALLFLLLATLPAGSAGTPEPVGGEFQVNTTAKTQTPAMAVDGGGNFVAVWQSDSLSGILGQRFDSAGGRVGGEFQVNTNTTGSEFSPAVAADADGNFVIAWTTDGLGFYGYIRGQLFDSTGVPIGGELQVNTYTLLNLSPPAVAADGDGNFIITWRSEGSPGSDTNLDSVQARRYDSAGTALGGQFQVNTYTLGNQGLPAVAAAAGGEFVVVWQSEGSAGSDVSGSSIQGQRFDAAGATVGDQFQVNTHTPDDQWEPSVAVATDGGFAVAWYSFGSDGSDTSSYSIHTQSFDAAGAPAGDELQANTYTTGFQLRPAVTAVAGGDFVVVWQSDGSNGTDNTGYSVQGQRFSSAGALGDEFQVNTYTTDSQYYPAVAADPSGRFVVVWESAADFSIQGQRFRVPLFADGFESGDTAAWSSSVP